MYYHSLGLLKTAISKKVTYHRVKALTCLDFLNKKYILSVSISTQQKKIKNGSVQNYHGNGVHFRRRAYLRNYYTQKLRPTLREDPTRVVDVCDRDYASPSGRCNILLIRRMVATTWMASTHLGIHVNWFWHYLRHHRNSPLF